MRKLCFIKDKLAIKLLITGSVFTFYLFFCVEGIASISPEISQSWTGRDCERLFGSARYFSKAKEWRETSPSDEVFYLEQEEIRVILMDQHRVLVHGFQIGFAVTDQTKLYDFAGATDKARVRIESELNDLLRTKMGKKTSDNIESFDFVETLRNDQDFRKFLFDMGLDIFLVDTSRASFNLSISACEM